MNNSLHCRLQPFNSFKNENVNRHGTSARQVRDLRRPDRHTPVNVLVTKTYRFVERVWAYFFTGQSLLPGGVARSRKKIRCYNTMTANCILIFLQDKVYCLVAWPAHEKR